MRHKWTAILVVMFTTLTTAQEALKQYDDFKAQASTWATLSLWTGFLSAYEPTAEPLQAHVTTCQTDQPRAQAQQPYATALAQTIRRESLHRHNPSNPSLRIEVSVIEDNRPGDSFEAGREALASVREVALLNENGDAEPAEPFEHTAGMAEPVVALRELNEVELTVRALRRVRLAANQAARDEAAPLAAEADSEAAQQRTRAVIRAQEQKSRAMKRGLKALQTKLDKAARQELSRAKDLVTVELPDGISIALGAAGGPGSIAPRLPLAPPQPLALPAVMTGGGGCTSE